METKQITETIKTGEREVNGNILFYAWLKMPHMRKSRYYASVISEEDAIKQVREFEEEEIKRKAEQKTALSSKRQARAEKDREAAKNCRVGQIFVETWGYDQTNVDYFQVISVKGVTATLQAIESIETETQPMAGHSVPVKDHFKGKPFQKRVVDYGEGRPSFSGVSHGWMSLWDGKPVGCSSYA
jgi:cell division protein YceG involved in septum cleavage